MLKRALVAALAASLLAAPATARPWQRHHGPGHNARHHRVDRYADVHRHGHHVRVHHRYRYHRHHVADDAFLWLGLTVFGVTALHLLSHEQQRRLEEARWQAATAPIGRSVVWYEGEASGAVTPVREGLGEDGQYCREFQQEIRIDGRTERAWGIACLEEDGSWRITR